MKPQQNSTVSIFSVRFSDGGTFQISVKSASEYLLDSSFVRFLFLCILLYGVLLHREDVAQLEAYNQVMLWIVMFVVTAGWILFSAGLNVYLVSRGFVSFVFTPFIIIPMVPINIFAAGFVAEYLGAEYWLTFPEIVGPIAQNIVAAVCFDILHGRYVAPTHPAYVRADRRLTASADRPKGQFGQVVAAPDQNVVEDENDPAASETQVAEVDTTPATAPSEFFVTISGQRLDIRELVYVRSEDHYLKIQQVHSSKLLRGKLKETVTQLNQRLGIQINRSVWIAFASVKRVDENKAGYLEVTLTEDTKFKITNSRKMMFLQNYEHFRDQQTRVS